MHAQTSASLTPLALKNTPALIETVFPAQKVSFEAQRERKAVQSQTLRGDRPVRGRGSQPLVSARRQRGRRARNAQAHGR
jgi:hypothetical protein